jgi:hypothetical protein
MIKVKPQTVAAKQIKLSWEDENINEGLMRTKSSLKAEGEARHPA